MRILYVIHQFYPESSSGTERFVLNLATSMQRCGHRAEVITYSFEHKSAFHSTGQLLVKEYRYNGISVTAVRHEKLPIDINIAPRDPDILRLAGDLLGERHYDLMHIAHPMRLAAFSAAATGRGIPYVLTLTDFWTICPKITLRTSFETLCAGPETGAACSQLCPELDQQLVKSRLRAMEDILRGAKVIISPSQFAAAIVQREFEGLPIAVVPHGLKLSQMKPNGRSYQPDSPIIFAYCGGLAAHKGVHVLVRAFQAVKADNAELHIYGAASEQEKDYDRVLRTLGEKDKRIYFRGAYREEETGRVFRAIDVLVIPSLCYETYSFALHEAVAANVPVIVPAIGALDEKVEDGVTGIKFVFGNEHSLSQKMSQLAGDPCALNRLKAQLQQASVPVVEEESYLYERIYQTAVTGPPSTLATRAG